MKKDLDLMEKIANEYEEDGAIGLHSEFKENEKTGEACSTCSYESETKDINDFCPDCGEEVIMYTTFNHCECVLCGIKCNEEESLYKKFFPLKPKLSESLYKLEVIKHFKGSEYAVVCEKCSMELERIIVDIWEECI